MQIVAVTYTGVSRGFSHAIPYVILSEAKNLIRYVAVAAFGLSSVRRLAATFNVSSARLPVLKMVMYVHGILCFPVSGLSNKRASRLARYTKNRVGCVQTHHLNL